MAKLNELAKQQSAVDMANVPEQFGDFAPPPQPGRGYLFQLPRFSESDDFEEDETVVDGVAKKRLLMQFKGEKSLTIVESPTGEGIGDPVRFRCSSEERSFGDEGKSAVSPMHYLMTALHEVPSGWSSMQFAKAFIKHSGDKFRGDVTWSSYCNPDKVRYIWDEAQGKSVEDPDGNKGCGQRWAPQQRKNKKGEVTEAIPRNDETGKYETRFTCFCDAMLQPFVEIRNFKPAGDAHEVAAEQGVEVHSAPNAEVTQPAPAKATVATPQQAPKSNGPVAGKPSQTPVAGKQQATTTQAAPAPSAPRPAQGRPPAAKK